MIRRMLKEFRRYCEKRRLAKHGISIAHNVDFNHVDLGDYVNIAHHAQVSDSTIGVRTSIGRYSKIQFADIGKYCSISWDVTIGALEHPTHAVSTHAFSYRKQFGICDHDVQIPHKRVSIGNDVWIGCGAIIMPGVSIGNGAIIGAGGVVTHHVAPYEIVAGCPAKHITWRFSNDAISKLETIQWWDFSDEDLREYLEFFSPEIDLNIDNKCLDKLIQITEKRENK